MMNSFEDSTPFENWIKDRPDRESDVESIMHGTDGLTRNEAINRVWRIVQHFGEDVKMSDLFHLSVIGDLDYNNQGKIALVIHKNDISVREDFFEKHLILRGKDGYRDRCQHQARIK